MENNQIKGPIIALCVLVAILIIVLIWHPRPSAVSNSASSSPTSNYAPTKDKNNNVYPGSVTNQTVNSCSGKMSNFQAQTYARYTQSIPHPTITDFAVAYSSVLKTCIGTYATITYPDGDASHSLTQYSIVNLTSGQQLSGLPGMSGTVYVVDLNPDHASNHYQDYKNELSYLTNGALR